MAQQVNLLTPILLAPRRHFSALALLQATLVMVAAGAMAAVWIHRQDRRAQQAHAALLADYANQRQQLIVARAGLPASQDGAALLRRVQELEGGNQEREALLATLEAGDARRAGHTHSELLALVARTVPETAWISELRHTADRVEITGGTLDTAVLRPWLAQLAAHPLLAGQALTQLRVERAGARDAEPGHAALLPPDAALARSPLPVWSFRVVSTPQAAIPAAAGGRP